MIGHLESSIKSELEKRGRQTAGSEVQQRTVSPRMIPSQTRRRKWKRAHKATGVTSSVGLLRIYTVIGAYVGQSRVVRVRLGASRLLRVRGVYRVVRG